MFDLPFFSAVDLYGIDIFSIIVRQAWWIRVIKVVPPIRAAVFNFSAHFIIWRWHCGKPICRGLVPINYGFATTICVNGQRRRGT